MTSGKDDKLIRCLQLWGFCEFTSLLVIITKPRFGVKIKNVKVWENMGSYLFYKTTRRD